MLIERTEKDIILFTINRPEVRNAIDYDVMKELEKTIETIQQDPNIKAFVITGSGKDAFCSGGDLSIFHKLYTEEEAFKMLSRMGGILYKLLTLKCPTVALINGYAIGGGCELATACDYRIARNGVKVGFVQGKLAITTGWGGGTMLVEKLLHHQAYRMLFSANTYSALEAKEIGFIHEILSDEKWMYEGMTFTEKMIDNCSASVLSAYKEIAITKWKNFNVLERMLEEVSKCSSLWAKEEHHAAVKAFIEKSK
ncbi:enoyl-CoA hydratase/isomerase family protein [Bacillus salitolerans]|uniref:Ethylmalonyl-CoA decarboxylase n=1 Tax=Bacillus salitolerans TaxID=1437434 RepID=A0ABW4LKH3_9BACI